jgi:hypothetical protein
MSTPTSPTVQVTCRTTRRWRVAAFAVAVTQRTYSQLAIGVMLSTCTPTSEDGDVR